jgi:hypothetical protein
MKKTILGIFALLILSGCDQYQAKTQKCFAVISPPANAPILLNQCTGETWTYRGSLSVDGANNKYWWHPIHRDIIAVNPKTGERLINRGNGWEHLENDDEIIRSEKE